MFDDVRRVLRDSSDLLERTEALDGIATRTEQLARQVEHVSQKGTRRALTFRLGMEHYGWPVENVRAIARVGKLTPVPSAPPFYRGVTSLRGGVLSVMELRVLFGLPPVDPLPDLLVVIGNATLEIGVLADDVSDVIAYFPAELTSAFSELITGIQKDGLSILNAEALLIREARRATGAAADGAYNNDAQP